MKPQGQCDTASVKRSRHLGPFTRLVTVASEAGISATERCQTCGKTVVRRIKSALETARAQKLLPPSPDTLPPKP